MSSIQIIMGIRPVKFLTLKLLGSTKNPEGKRLTLVYLEKAKNEVPFGWDTGVVWSNIVSARVPGPSQQRET